MSRGTSRRAFVNWLLGCSVSALVASILYPVLRFISPPEIPEATTHEVEVGPTNDPELLDKGFKIVRFGEDPVIVVRAGEQQFRAFSATCTHLDCIVEYQPDKRLIWCNCHNGQFDLDGRNVGGPPPRPLTPFTVNVVPGDSGRPATIVVSKT